MEAANHPAGPRVRLWPRAVIDHPDFRPRLPAWFAVIELLLLAVWHVPAIVRATSVSPALLTKAVLLHIACMAVVGSLRGPRFASPAWAHARLAFALLYNISLILTVVVASGDLRTPWWFAFILYAGLVGALQELDAAWGIALILAAAPFVTAPFFIAGGVAAGDALAHCIIASAMGMLAYMTPARSSLILRAEREAQRQQADLARQRAAKLEREALCRDLHDAVGSKLAILAVYGDLLEQGRVDTAEMADIVRTLRVAAHQGLDDLRAVLNALTPQDWSVGALATALGALGDQVRVAGVVAVVDVEGDDEAPLPSAVAMVALRVAQEGVANALRHGRPRSLRLRLVGAAAELAVEVRDDGCGFVCDGIEFRGIRGLVERAAAVGGELDVDSRPGAGTRLRLRLPLAVAAPPSEAT